MGAKRPKSLVYLIFRNMEYNFLKFNILISEQSKD